MPEYLFSIHAKDMLRERDILEEWALLTINNPDKKSSGDDGNMHYFKPIPGRGNRVLHVVVNETVEPNRIVTLITLHFQNRDADSR